MPRYEVPMQQDFSDKELACLLAPRQAEMVVDTGVEAGVVLKETKGKATMDLADAPSVQGGAGGVQRPQPHGGKDIPPGGAGEKGAGSGGKSEGGRGPRGKRAKVVSLVAVTPEVEFEGDEEDEVHRLSTAIEASKAAPGVEDLAGSSHQAEALQDVGALHEEMKQDEEEAKVGPEAALQAQPWEWGSPQ
ncbi:hypothetical protein C0993_002340 [Termitomyces sp. T159_Od127]|nr:hypothetical protein C0993_002340 [Termitomyces sp. T159_Od127]